MGLLSEDRKQEGLALEMSIADNVTLSRLGRGFLSRTRLAEGVSAVLTRLGVKYRDARQPVGELSGGNQQKVALGRLFYQGADILLLDEPTKGVDVGSKAEIYRQIGAAAASGKAVIVVSSYLPELFGVCDTLAVMCRGKLTAPRLVVEWTPEMVITAATTTS
jgi:ribose transport system ATP-binding protein